MECSKKDRILLCMCVAACKQRGCCTGGRELESYISNLLLTNQLHYSHQEQWGLGYSVVYCVVNNIKIC